MVNGLEPQAVNLINMKWLQLIRWQNLLILALTLALFKYILFDTSTGLVLALSNLNFVLFVIAVLCIAAGGYIINDIQDIETDRINKSQRPLVTKSISETQAMQAYMIVTILGVCLGFYLANVINKSSYATYFIIIAAALYIYSTALKQIALLGNIVVAIIIAFAILLLGIYDIVPVMTSENQTIQTTFTMLLLDYAIFAFLVNLNREIVKDLEDVDGDYNVGLKTLPIILGRDRAGNIAFIFSLLPLMAAVYYTYQYLYQQTAAVGYFLIFVIAPLIYVSAKCFTASTKTHWAHISKILKLVMVFGVLSTLIFKWIRL